jgi:hypothetical protein
MFMHIHIYWRGCRKEESGLLRQQINLLTRFKTQSVQYVTLHLVQRQTLSMQPGSGDSCKAFSQRRGTQTATTMLRARHSSVVHAH